MTKTELAAEVAKKAGMTKKDAALAVNAVFDCMKEALAKGEKVQLGNQSRNKGKDRDRSFTQSQIHSRCCPQGSSCKIITQKKGPGLKLGTGLNTRDAHR